jgi:hypothetical protein
MRERVYLMLRAALYAMRGGIYLFETEASAHAWERQAKALQSGIGAARVLTQLLYSNEGQSEATPAELVTPAFA